VAVVLEPGHQMVLQVVAGMVGSYMDTHPSILAGRRCRTFRGSTRV
jgi:hypothetical protein